MVLLELTLMRIGWTPDPFYRFTMLQVIWAIGWSMKKPMAIRSALNLKIGLALCAAFIVLRASNFYGDPSPWSSQSSFAMTIISFLKCTKYPPSLCYLLMTLGPALCALGLMDTPREYASLRILSVFGGVPLFYYVLHLIIMRWTALPIGFYMEGDLLFMPPPKGSMGSATLPLWGAYIAWISVVLLLYPLCKKFAALKRRRKEWYWSYL